MELKVPLKNHTGPIPIPKDHAGKVSPQSPSPARPPDQGEEAGREKIKAFRAKLKTFVTSQNESRGSK